MIRATSKNKFFKIYLLLCIFCVFTIGAKDKSEVSSLRDNKVINNLSIVHEKAQNYRTSPKNVFVDINVQDGRTLYSSLLTKRVSNIAYHLFSHGRSGELLIEGTWKNAKEIAAWVTTNNHLKNKSHLNIYGCNFAKGEKGKQAVSYLEEVLGVSIAASDDITGIDGDWNLEVGNSVSAIQVPNYTANLQYCPGMTYDIYAYYRTASNNTTDANYEVNAGAGVTSIDIDQTTRTNVYTYQNRDFVPILMDQEFRTNGSIAIFLEENSSTTGSWIIADAILFVDELGQEYVIDPPNNTITSGWIAQNHASAFNGDNHYIAVGAAGTNRTTWLFNESITSQPDLDGDSVPDFCDLDDDNDGIEDCDERFTGGIYFSDPLGVDEHFFPNSFNTYTGTLINPSNLHTGTVTSHPSGNFGIGIKTGGTAAGGGYSFTAAKPISILRILPYTQDVGGVFTPNDQLTFDADVPITITNPQNHLTVSVNGITINTFPHTTSDPIYITPNGSFPVGSGLDYSLEMENITDFSIIMQSSYGNPNGTTFLFDADCLLLDTDGDGISDNEDLDADGDGCPDVLESAGNNYTWADLNPDGSLNTTLHPTDANGVPNNGNNHGEGTSRDPNVVAPLCDPCDSISPFFSDNDLDGIGDACDLDDDNDGILDTDEGLNCDIAANWEGLSLTTPITQQVFNSTTGNLVDVTLNVLVDTPALLDSNPVNSSRNGGIGNINDADKVSITATESIKFKITGKDVTSVATGTWTTNEILEFTFSNGYKINDPNGEVTIVSRTSNSVQLLANVANVPNFSLEATSDFMSVEQISGGNPISAIMVKVYCNILDTDSDGIPDHLDADSDGDGCTDAVEAGHIDLNQDGIVDGTGTDADGKVTGATTAYTGNTAAVTDIAINSACCDVSKSGYLDVDGDGIANFCDLDHDNDGITNVNECDTNSITNGDFTGAAGLTGWTTTNHWFHRGNKDAFVNDNTADTSNLSQTITVATSSAMLHYDLVGNVGFARDAFIEVLVNNVLVDRQSADDIVANAVSGSYHRQIPLNVASGATATIVFRAIITDGTGTADDVGVDNIFVGACDDDGDDIPNYLEIDSDGDGCTDAVEAGHIDLDQDGIVDGTGIDSDGKVTGAITAYTGNTAAVRDAFINSACCDVNKSGHLDSDGDGIANFCDLDHDNDGITNVNECDTNSITNGDFTGAAAGLTGWTTTNHWFHRGNKDAFVNDNTAGTSDLSQTITVATSSAMLHYDLVGNDGFVREAFIEIYVNSVLVDRQSADNIVANAVSGSYHRQIPLNLASGSTATILFRAIVSPGTGGADDVGVDNIFVGACDDDGDDIPNYLEIDSDGDGCTDAVEAGHIDLNQDGIVDGTGIDSDGKVTGAITAYTGNTAGVRDATINNACCDVSKSGYPDYDGDGVGDNCDLDNDNDGILDATEGCMSGTVSSPFTSLGMARNVTNAGIYYFNLAGNAFSTYVDANGYVQIAIDFGNGVGNLPQSTSLTTSTRGILNTTTLASLTDLNEVRISHSGEQVDVSSTNAEIKNRILNNQTLHRGVPDNLINDDWIGTGAVRFTANASCTSSYGTNLYENIIHVCGNAGTFTWIPRFNYQRYLWSSGEISSGESLSLWVRANAVEMCLDTDTDGIPDNRDLDSDGDGCNDVIEAGFTDDNNDGLLGPAGVTVDSDGKVTSGSDGYTTPKDGNLNSIYDFIEAGSQNSITTQANDLTVCPGCDATFTVVASGDNTYQWQENTGTGWNDLSEGGKYSGTLTTSLVISQAITAMNTNQYRVIVTSTSFLCNPVESDAYILTVKPKTVITNRRISIRVKKN